MSKKKISLIKELVNIAQKQIKYNIKTLKFFIFKFQKEFNFGSD